MPFLHFSASNQHFGSSIRAALIPSSSCYRGAISSGMRLDLFAPGMTLCCMAAQSYCFEGLNI
jgi:hypothetical protein